jgi:hypothetical protein
MDERTLLPVLVVRTTGFPFELIERLRFTWTTTKPAFAGYPIILSIFINCGES